MPRLVADLLKRPSMMLILCFIGSSGDNVLLSFMSAPDPSALQWFSLIPHPMKRTPKRFGNTTGELVGAPTAENDSSHGSATATPAPRNTARREIASDISIHLSFRRAGIFTGFGISFVQELRAGDNGFHQRAEAIIAGR